MIVNAPISEVYEALTTQRGFVRWWTTSCEVGAAEGDSITIRFGDTFKVMSIEALCPVTDIAWRVVQAHLVAPGVTRKDEWVGTDISFHLMPLSLDSTQLLLTHTGLTRESECYDICSQGWGLFMGSLKDYLERGSGIPFTDPPTR